MRRNSVCLLVFKNCSKWCAFLSPYCFLKSHLGFRMWKHYFFYIGSWIHNSDFPVPGETCVLSLTNSPSCFSPRVLAFSNDIWISSFSRSLVVILWRISSDVWFENTLKCWKVYTLNERIWWFLFDISCSAKLKIDVELYFFCAWT